MISSGQIRAARALLRWTAVDLAARAGLGVATIRRLELVDGVPSSNTKTLQSIRRAFESCGIEFIGTPEDGPGVRIKGSEGGV